MKLVYFVHDLTDPAVRRRVRMLQAGGASPVVLGFRREAAAPTHIEGAPAIDLGRTYDARMAQRAGMTLLTALRAARLREHLKDAEVVMARSLEMLAVAEAARRMAGGSPRLVYECLDIHRLMLAVGGKGRALRYIERALLRRADLLVVSSPAFVSAYFHPVQGVGRDLRVPTLLLENKVLELEPERPGVAPAPSSGPPWRIGWLGAIRCARSLAVLTDLARGRPDLVEISIHGRPAYAEFVDFDAQVAAAPKVSFGGGYTAADLPRLYGGVHFAWAIDFMEEGLNSSWLLPNRLYEASRHGAVPIALNGVQTGRYLADHGFGLRIDRPEDLEAVLERLTPERYAALRAELGEIPLRAFVADAEDCRAMVAVLAGRRPRPTARATHFEVGPSAFPAGVSELEHNGGQPV